MMDVQALQRALGGEVRGGEVLCPGPDHSDGDRSLSVRPDPEAPEGFLVHSFAGDDPQACRDYVRKKLGLPAPEEKDANSKKNGSGNAWTLISEHVYRDEHGEPYLRVRKCRDENGKKQYPQAHWDGNNWTKGKPKGPKLPYRLPQLIAASVTATVYFCEGEKDSDNLAKIGFLTTTASEGAAAKWDPALTQYFKDRHVVILPDADRPGRAHGQKVARAITNVAASVRVLDLYPERHDGSDVSNWLEADTAGARLAKLAREAPLWEPGADDGKDHIGDKSDDELIAELAALPRLQYERRREEAAEKLGVRVSVLDKLVAARAESEDETKEPSPTLYAHWAVEPAAEPVDGAILLRAIAEALRRYVVMTDDQALVVALWVIFTWLHEQIAVHSPILLVTSPLPNSGKTTLLKLIGFVVRNGLSSVSITGPALFRSIEKWAPTIAIDEADTAFVNNDDLKEVVNSGWTRGDTVIRCDPETHDPRPYSTFCPKAIGLIGGKLPPATLSRCLMIAMRRKRPDEHADDFDHTDNEHLARLRSWLLRWATDNVEALAKAEPEIPAGLHNRTRMNWRGLLAIAERAGGGWKRSTWKAVRAIEEVHAAADPELGAQLLLHIRDAFDRRGTDRMTTRSLLDELAKDTEGPWAAYGKSGKPISDRQLFRLLKDFRQGHGIRSRNIRVDSIAGPVKGYLRADFEDDFASYISDVAAKTPSSTTTPLQMNIFNQLERKSSATSAPEVADENRPNPLETIICSGVAAKNHVLAATGDDGVAESVDGSPVMVFESCEQSMAGTAAAGASLPPEDRSCRHCDGPLDGTEQLCAIDGVSIWLHPECQRPYLDRVCR